MLTLEQKEQLKKNLIQYNALYYEPPSLSLEQDFSKYPGQLKINRVLNGKSSVFYIPGNSPNRQKKTIVISDWTIFISKNEFFLSVVKEILKALVEEGFDLRVWNGENLRTISDQAQLENILTIKAVSEEKINQKLAQENIPGDAIFHLNYFEMNKILHYENKFWNDSIFNELRFTDNVLKFSELLVFDTIPQEIFDWLRNKKFILSISETDPLHEKKLTKFLSDFSENIIGIRIEKLTDTSIFAHLSKLPNLQELKWSEDYDYGNRRSKIEGNDWVKTWSNKGGKFSSKLKKLIIEKSSIPSNILSELIENSENLTEVKIHYCDNLSELKIISNKDTSQFKQLKIIDIDESNIDADSIFSLISNASLSLENLKLYSVTVKVPSNIYEQLNENSFASLRNLNFFSSTIENAGGLLECILKKSPNIETLRIYGCYGLKSISAENLSTTAFLKLKSVSFDKTDFPAKTLGKLLSFTSSQLEDLHLVEIQDFENFTPDLIDEAIVFKQLKTCMVFDHDYSAEKSYTNRERKIQIPLGTYLKIISISPNITTINLEYANNLTAEWHANSLINLEKIDLLKITHIAVPYSDIDGKLLVRLLSLAKNLGSIDLSSCKNIANLKPEDIPDDIIFENLTHIFAAGSAIRGDTLAKIISRSPKLYTFNIDKCTNINSFNLSTHTPKTYLVNFNGYTAVESSFPLKEYLALISCSPKITCLDLRSINLSDDVDDNYLARISLEHIESIIIPNEKNVGKIFGRLLSAAKNVRIIRSGNTYTYHYNYHDTEKNDDDVVVDHNDIPNNLVLDQLEGMDFSGIAITGKAVAKLVKSATNIQNINLNKCKNCADFTPDLIPQEFLLPKFQSLACDGSNLPLATIIKLSTYIPHTKYRYISSYDNQFDSAVIKFTSSWPSYSYKQTFTIPSGVVYESVKELELGDNDKITGTFIDEILNATPNLEKLSVILSSYDKKLKDSDSSKIRKTFPSLKDIIFKSKLPQTTMEHIIAGSFNLVSLELIENKYSNFGNNNSDVSNNTRLPIGVCFNRLEHVTANGNCVSSYFLYYIITKAPNLKILDLIKTNLPYDTQEFSNSELFKNIEIVNWIDSEIPETCFLALLNSQKLQKISIDNCRSNFRYNLKSPITNLSALTELNLKNFSLDYRFVEHLIENGEHLEKIILSAKDTQSYIFDSLLASGKSLPDLTYLELENLSLPVDFVKKIHILFPKLETLIIKNCTGLNVSEKDLGLKSSGKPNLLKKLVIDKSDISNIGLKNLILNQPDLRYIEITNCINMSDIDFTENEFSTLSQKLDTIEIKNSPISGKTYRWFCSQNNLVKLHLSYSHIKSSPNLKNSKLEKIYELDLSHSEMDYEAFIALISRMNSLQRLDLNSLKLHKVPVKCNPIGIDLPKNLSFLDCGCSNLPVRLIMTIYSESKSLTHLDLYNYEQVNISDLDQSLNSTAIDKIKITKCKFTLEDFSMLMKKSPLVKILTVSSSSFASSNRMIPNIDTNYHALEEITLVDSEMNFDLFISLISKAKKLKKLTINSLRLIAIPESFDYSTIQFPKTLEKIDFNDTKLPLELILALHDNNKLGAMKFNNYHDVGYGAPNTSTYNLKLINLISFNKSSLTLDGFFKLLSSAKKCQELSIIDSKFTLIPGEKISRKILQYNYKLNNLNKISFKEVKDFSGELFISLLIAASGSLTSIDITDSTISQLSADMIPDNLSLPNLTSFTFITSNVTPELSGFFNKIKACAPKLKSITTENPSLWGQLNYSNTNNTSRNTDTGFSYPSSPWSSTNSGFSSRTQSRTQSRISSSASSGASFSSSSSTNKLQENGSSFGGGFLSHLFGKNSGTVNERSLNKNSRLNTSTEKTTKSKAEKVQSKTKEPQNIGKEKKSSSKTNTAKDNYKDSTNYNIAQEVKTNSKTPKEIFAKEIFVTNYNPQKPHPRDFRFGAYHSVEETADGFILKPNPDKKLHDVKYENSSTPLRKQFQAQVQKNPDDYYALCETDFILSEEWRPLPSLHSHDEQLLYFYTDSKLPYEIKYSEEDNLYYIRKKINGKNEILDSVDTEANINISFILQLPDDVENKLEAALPEEIDSLIKECSKPEVGTCLQRSIAFHNKFRNFLTTCKDPEKYKNYRTRIITNRIHAYIEIFDGEIWKKGPELGGVAADLKIKKMDTAKLNIPKRQIKAKTKETKPSNVIKPAEKKPGPKKINEADLCPDFVTWKDKKETIFKSPEELFQRIVVAGNHLIKIENPDDCLKIMAEFSKLNKPYLFIDSPDDLQWRAPGLKFKESNNLGIHGKFSKVRYFIEQYPNGVLFINWSNFKPSDIVALHSIIDPDRILEEEALPQSLSIVSFLANNSPNAYKGSDFTSRSVEYTWKFKTENDVYKNRVIKRDLSPDDEILTIDLYESEDWETLLFGFIQIQKKQFSLDRSNFLENIEQSLPLKSLYLKNPPWHLRSFQLFWQDALQQNQFSLYGKTFYLDKEFKLFYSNEYNWHLESITAATDENAFAYPLNQHTFYKFFPHYIESNEDGFKKEIGLLQKHKIITLVVTEKLTENQWCRLLAEAKKLNVKIHIELASPYIELPVAMKKVPTKEFENKGQMLLEHKDLEVLEQMPYALVWAPKAVAEVTKVMLERYPDALYINFDSTHDFSDLFYQIKASMNEEEILAEFVKSYPWRALAAGQTVIIEGSLPKALINALSPMFISGKLQIYDQEKVHVIGNQKGKLIFVTDTPIVGVRNELFCNIRPNQISKLFSNKKTGKEEIEDDDEWDNKEKKSKKDKDLTTNTTEIQKTDSEDLSFEEFRAYEDRRFEKIQEGFLKSPLIFYTGPTGIGKTTYLTEEFEQDYLTRTSRKAKLYIGESAIEAFAAHFDENVDPFLLIDEADLSNTKLSFLKSIKNQKKPHLLVNGNYYHTPRHKVFFVGNGKKYGGARQQSEFFEEHTEQVSCERPTQPYLYHKIIQPKLLKNFSAKESAEIAKTILNIFNKINEIVSSLEPLLSPRHLHIVTVLFNAYTQQPHLSRVTRSHLICAAFIDVLGKRLNLEQQQKLIQFLKEKYTYDAEQIYKIKTDYIKEKLSQINKKDTNFSFTESRYSILQLLDTFLNLRNQEDFHFGILLEGASGTGKSTLIKNYLKILGISFIQFSWGKNYETDCKILLRAYFQGKVILLDELNANGPKYERLVNTIIMKNDKELIQIAKEVYGVNYFQFEEKIIKNKKAGCLMISTQNSISLAGRQALSTALQARFTPLDVPEYSDEELLQILQDLGVEKARAISTVNSYIECRDYAAENSLDPQPNLRNLLRVLGVEEKFVENNTKDEKQEDDELFEKEGKQEETEKPNKPVKEILTPTQSTSPTKEAVPTAMDPKIAKEKVSDNTKEVLYDYNKKFIADITILIKEIESKKFAQDEDLKHDKLAILNFLKECVEKINPTYLALMMKEITTCRINNFSILKEKIETSFVDIKLNEIVFNKQYNKDETIYSLLKSQRRIISQFFPIFATNSKLFIDRYTKPSSEEIYNSLTESENSTEQSNSYQKQ